MNFSGGFAKILTASAVGPLLLFVASPLLSRLYSPEQYGAFGISLTVCTALSVVLALRFELVYLKYRQHKERVLTIGLVVTVLTSSIFLLLMVAIDLGSYIAIDTGFTFWLLLLTTGLMGFYGHVIVADKDYSNFSKAKIFQSVSQVVVAIVLGLIGVFSGLVLALIFAQFAFLGLSYYKRRDAFSLHGAPKYFFENKGYSIKNSCTGLLQSVSPAAPVILISYYLGGGELGAFFFTVQVFAAPAAIVRRSLYHFVTAEFADSNANELRAVLHKYTFPIPVILFLLFFGVAVLYLCGGQIFGLVFGESWRPAGQFAWFVALYFFVDTVLQPFSSLLSLWGKENTYLFIEIGRVVLVLLIPLLLVGTGMVDPTVEKICLLVYFGMTSAYLVSIFVLLRPKG